MAAASLERIRKGWVAASQRNEGRPHQVDPDRDMRTARPRCKPTPGHSRSEPVATLGDCAFLERLVEEADASGTHEEAPDDQ